VHNSAVDLAYPAWAAPNAAQDITDLSYWVNEVLPFEQDKDAAMYLVYPKAGVVLPITQPSYEDQRLIASGKMFDHYPYLEQAGLFYYGESPDYGKSNMVIAAHSSFDKQQPGRYKTVFQALPISRAGDKIFLYIKNEQ
jgi:sortase (surface protein transpeptidase)